MRNKEKQCFIYKNETVSATQPATISEDIPIWGLLANNLLYCLKLICVFKLNLNYSFDVLLYNLLKSLISYYFKPVT